MQTICRKCGWSGGRGRACCFAPWEPNEVDLVTGKVTKFSHDCKTRNNGSCGHFKPRLLKRILLGFIDAVLSTNTRNNYVP
jgi:hypothetical protein